MSLEPTTLLAITVSVWEATELTELALRLGKAGGAPRHWGSPGPVGDAMLWAHLCLSLERQAVVEGFLGNLSTFTVTLRPLVGLGPGSILAFLGVPVSIYHS